MKRVILTSSILAVISVASADPRYVVDNDQFQVGAALSQSNSVQVGPLAASLGKVQNIGTNVVNQATLDVKADRLVIGNDIGQVAGAVSQNNSINTSGLAVVTGEVKLEGKNLVNVAESTLKVDKPVSAVVGNDIGQVAVGVSQNNSVGTVLGATGKIDLVGTNAVNSADMGINAGQHGFVGKNDVGQVAVGIQQNNSVGVAAGITAGTINVTGTNAVNISNVKIR